MRQGGLELNNLDHQLSIAHGLLHHQSGQEWWMAQSGYQGLLLHCHVRHVKGLQARQVLQSLVEPEIPCWEIFS